MYDRDTGLYNFGAEHTIKKMAQKRWPSESEPAMLRFANDKDEQFIIDFCADYVEKNDLPFNPFKTFIQERARIAGGHWQAGVTVCLEFEHKWDPDMKALLNDLAFELQDDKNVIWVGRENEDYVVAQLAQQETKDLGYSTNR